jgi:hypothetical protein
MRNAAQQTHGIIIIQLPFFNDLKKSFNRSMTQPLASGRIAEIRNSAQVQPDIRNGKGRIHSESKYVLLLLLNSSKIKVELPLNFNNLEMA